MKSQMIKNHTVKWLIISQPCFPVSFQSSSVSPSASFRGAEKHRNSTDYSSDSKKQKTEEKEIATRYVCSFTFAVGEASLPCFLSIAILPFDYYQ